MDEMMGFLFRRAWLPRQAWLFVAVLLLAGCAPGTAGLTTTQSITPVEANPSGFAAWTDMAPEYRVNAGDRLRVQFLLTPELAEEVLVAPDGSIGLRAAGMVNVQNMTLRQVQEAVRQAAAQMLTNPIVTVSVADPAGARVFVGGSVVRAGAYPIDSRRGAMEAILLAGGFDRESRADQVVLIRRNPDNRPMLRTVDLRNFLSSGGVSGDVPLFAGDIVYVPRNRISEVDLWVEQFITKLLPFNRGFDYTINRSASSAAFL
jgi:protein involved in polysaccharide export with SLBB domain